MRKAFTLIELMIVVVIVAIILSIIVSHFGRNAKKREACVRLWALTKTAHDSIEVIRACDIPEQTVPVYIRTFP